MRIAYFLGHFPVLSETFIGEEMRAMEAMGHILFPIALQHPRVACQREDSALVDKTLYFSSIGPEASRGLLRQYRVTRYRIHRFASQQTTEPYLPLLVHAAHLANYIKDRRCTHIHAHFAWGATTYAIAAAKLLKLPITFTCHGSDAYAHPLDLHLKCRNANAVIGVAPTITADLQKIAPQTPCHTVYCGVDTCRFKPQTDWLAKHDRWLFIGRLMDCKGIDDILAAWAALSPASRPELDIVGDGPLKESLESYVQHHRLGTHVRFLGARPSAWIAENAPNYRTFISVFKRGRDGSADTAPMVLKEAMAMGLPIVTTDFMDIPGIVGKDCAITCPASSVDGIAKAVLSMQTLSQKALQEMGRAGRLRAESLFSLRQQSEKLTKLFHSKEIKQHGL